MWNGGQLLFGSASTIHHPNTSINGTYNHHPLYNSSHVAYHPLCARSLGKISEAESGEAVRERTNGVTE